MLDKKHTSKEWEQLWKDLEETKNMPSFQETAGKVADTKNIKMKDFGIGAAMMANYQDPLKGLAAEIRGGAGHIEFSPSIQQGQGAHSFTKLSAEKRQAMKELKKINKTTISTHAHAGVTGLSGFNRERYSFDEDARQNSVNEIRKAIDFAADVAEGGSITFHAGDFARPLAGMESFGDQFEKSAKEQDNLIVGLIDKNTQSLAEGSYVKQNNKVIVPVFKYKSDDPKERIRIEGLDDEKYKGKYTVPTFEKEGNEVATKEFDNFREYAAYLVNEDEEFKTQYLDKNFDKSKYIKKNKEGKEEITDYYILEKAAKKKFVDDQKVNLVQQANQNLNSMNRQVSEIKMIKGGLERAKKRIEEENLDKVYILKDLRRGSAKVLTEKELAPRGLDYEDVIEFNKKGVDDNAEFEGIYLGDVKVKDLANREKESQLSRASFISQVKDRFDKLERDYETISDYAAEQNKNSMGQLGMELYEKNRQLEQKAKKEGRKHEQLYFAIENIFPEHHGAHPEELLKTINDSRKAMEEQLKEQYKMDSEKAKKIAENSIKATFDTGHLHMWKKYFKRKEGDKRKEKESDDSWDKRFNEWALNETKKLIKAGVIGNVHLADNFGFDDDHLTLGQGNVPIKEYMKMFDKAISEGKITGKFSVEGFDDSGERHGVHEAWKTTGTQIFKGQQATERWTNPSAGGTYDSSFSRLDQSTTGYYNKPSFIFGKYSPDKDEWSPWSDTMLE
jgi:hypothetical protein